jgi:hypothetical protein
VTCPCCQRTNASHRRFCGSCGYDLACVCAACAFQNTVDDRYCGGCGVGFGDAPARIKASPNTTARIHVVSVSQSMPPVVGTSPPPLQASKSVDAGPSDEMAALFSAPPVELETQLPEAGIVQADVDRLFGVIP